MKVESLEKLDSSKDISNLISKLNAMDWKIRYKAAKALGRIKDSRAVDSLVKALGDGRLEVQKESAKSLGRIGDKRAIEPLIKNLSSLSGKDCLQALVNIGKPAIPYLIKAINSRNKYIRWKAIKALGLIGDKRTIEPLFKALDDKDEFVRMRAVEALGKIGDRRAVPTLINLLDDDDEFVRIYTIEALGKLNDPRAIQPLEVTYSMKNSTKSMKESIRKAINQIKSSDIYRDYLNSIKEEMEVKIEMERRRRQKEGIYAPSWEIEEKSKILKELEGFKEEKMFEEFEDEYFETLPLLDIDYEDSNTKEFEKLEIERHKFSICPFCGRKLILEKTPEFCPFCDELLILE